MSEEVLNAFFDEFEQSYPGLKRAKNKPYALMALKSKAEIALAVKKKSVKVEISSPGGDDALSPDALKSWAEDNDILDTDIDGQCFELAAGARNKDKLSVVVEIPLESEDQVGDDMFQADVKAAMDLIWNNLSELVDASSANEGEAAPAESQQSVATGGKIDFSKTVPAGAGEVPFADYLVNSTANMLRKEDADAAKEHFNEEIVEFLEKQDIEVDDYWWWLEDDLFKEIVRFILTLPPVQDHGANVENDCVKALGESGVIQNILDNALWDGKDHLEDEDPAFWASVQAVF